MRSFIFFLTTPTADTPGTSLLLHFDDKRYLFGNIAEGTQRAIGELRSKVTKITDIFLTGPLRWPTVSGLPGLLITISDVQHTAKSSAAAIEAERRLRKEHRRTSNAASASSEDLLGPDVAETANIVAQRPEERLRLHGGRNAARLVASVRPFIAGKTRLLDVHEFRNGEGYTASDALGAESTLIHVSETRVGPDLGETTSSSGQSWLPTWSDEHLKMWVMHIEPQSPESPRRPRKRTFAEHEGDSDVHPIDATASESAINQSGFNEFHHAVTSNVLAEGLEASEKLSASNINASASLQDEKATEPLDSLMGEGGLADTSAVRPSDAPGRSGMEGHFKTIHLPPSSQSAQSTSYIVKNHPQRGAFLPEKATALKLKPGPLWRELTLGKSVVAADGSTVTPEMVMGKSKPGGGFAIVDLPTTSYVQDLVSRKEWRSKEVMEGIGAIIWILGPGVSQDPRLQRFVEEMPRLEHIVSSPEHCPNHLVFSSAGAMAVKHHWISDAQFPMPVYNNIPALTAASDQPEEVTKSLTLFEAAKPGLTLQLEPKLELQRDLIVPPFDLAVVSSDALSAPLRLAEETKRALATPEKRQEIMASQSDLPGQDAEIVTLGTGSMIPSSYRNVSGTLLRVPGHGTYIFDCGENTLGQLRRIYPADELAEVLRDLKAIWISHLHADHHLGLISVIRAWHEATSPGKDEASADSADETRPGEMQLEKTKDEQRNLYVMSSNHVLTFLRERSDAGDYDDDRVVPITVEAPLEDHALLEETRFYGFGVSIPENLTEGLLTEETRSELGVADIQAVRVDHCFRAMAVSFTFPNGFKFSYSGDCRPSEGFAKIGKGSTVLLHEATFDDELQADARYKKHCTTSEALGVAIAMRARRVILTHFSQRYPKIPILETILAVKQSMGEGQSMKDASAPATQGEPMSSTDDGAQEDLLQGSSDGDAMTEPAETRAHDMKVAVAFDYMRVKVGEIIHLEHLNPALRELFEVEEREREAEKTARRATEHANIEKKAERPAEVAAQKRAKKAEKEARRLAVMERIAAAEVQPGEGRVVADMTNPA